MITPSSNPKNHTPRKTRKLGDLEIVRGIVVSPFWKMLFVKPKQAFLMVLGQYLKASSVILSNILTTNIRIQPGSNVSGILLTICGISAILAFNSIYVWKILTPFVVIAVPLLPLWIEPDDLHRLIFIDIHSQALLIWAGVFTLFSLIHTVMNWLGKGNREASKRGKSLLYLLAEKLLSRHMCVSEFFFLMLETLIVMSIGIYLWAYVYDPYFGGFLVLISANELVLLLVDKAHQAHAQTLINS